MRLGLSSGSPAFGSGLMSGAQGQLRISDRERECEVALTRDCCKEQADLLGPGKDCLRTALRRA